MRNSKEITITQTEALILLALMEGKTKAQIIHERNISESTWFNHVRSIRDKITGGWKDDAPTVKLPSMADQIKAEILSLVQDGKNPLIQSDVISSFALMGEIRRRNKCYPCDAQVAQGIKGCGMVSVGRMLLLGTRHYLWALPGMERNQAVARVHARLMGQSTKA
jgi:hypothetical protein